MTTARAILLLLALSACSGGPQARRVASKPHIPPVTVADQRSLERIHQHMRAREYKQAESALRELLSKSPGLQSVRTDLGIVLARLGRDREAIRQLRDAITVDQHDAIAWNWLASLLRQSGDYQAAERAYRSALDANPGDASTHHNLALLYDVDLNRPADAVRHYRRYQQLASQDALIVEAWLRAAQDRLDQTATMALAP